MKKTNDSWRTRSYQLKLYLVMGILATSCIIGLLQPGPIPTDPMSPGSFWSWFMHPIEMNPELKLYRISTDLNAIYHLPGSDHVWVVGGGGLILHSKDRGHTWKQEPVSGRFRPSEVPPPDKSKTPYPKKAPSDGYQKQSSSTSDFHLTDPAFAAPDPQPLSEFSETLNAVFFASPTRGWAVGNSGVVVTYTNGHWQVDDAASRLIPWDLNGLLDLDGHLMALGTTRHLILTKFRDRPSEQSQWQIYEQYPEPNTAIRWVEAIAAKRIRSWGQNGGVIWAVGKNGQVYVSSDKDPDANPLRNPGAEAQTDLRGLWINGNTMTGWAVGSEGKLLQLKNGQFQLYEFRRQPTDNSLNAVVMDPETDTGWAVGEAGTMLISTDGGNKWYLKSIHYRQMTGKYRKFPGPWVYLIWLVVGIYLFTSLKTAAETKEAEIEESISNTMISDRPLEMSDPDPLGFKPIAKGLSQFIRNENTQPPLTIGITGPWGCGKSSLMNLLKSDLMNHHFYCAWFNAWHHQKEEHLLASLLANIHSQAIPPWWDLRRLGFRIRLLWRRLGSNFPVLLILICAYALFGSYSMDILEKLMDAKSLVDALPKELETAHGTGSIAALVTLLLGSLAFILRWFRVFGVRPDQVMASFSKNLKVSDFKQQAGFRFQFAQEFRDMTEAMRPYGLVILIDDLDRCRPENVLEILEAVNFLVSSGKCFIIMGLDLDRVERCVGLGFREVAEELMEDREEPMDPVGDPLAQKETPKSESSEMAAKRRRAAFARQYLEKLINIEVPVPVPTSEQSMNLLLHPTEPLSQTEKVKRWVTQVFMVIHPILLLSVAVYFGILFGTSMAPQKAKTTKAPIISRMQGTETSRFMAPSSRDVTMELTATKKKQQPAVFAPAQPPAAPLLPTIVPIILVAIFVIRYMFFRHPHIVKDSPEFKTALKIWHPFIFSRRNQFVHQITPRTLKRFMNRLRYFATRIPYQTAGTNPDPSSEEAHETPNGSRTKLMDESILVALCTLQHFCRDWTEEPRMWSLIKNGKTPESMPFSESHQDILKQAIDAHQRTFGNWPPSDQDFQILAELSRGIRVI